MTHKTLRTFLPASREDRHPYRIRHLPNDYRQWKPIAVIQLTEEAINNNNKLHHSHTHTQAKDCDRFLALQHARRKKNNATGC